MFHRGQKVVCVEDGRLKPGLKPASLWIKAGSIYTVRKIGENPYAPWRVDGPAVWLEEVLRDGGPCWPDFPFVATRFRPLVETKTDISTLIALLNPVNHKHLEGV